MRLLIGVIAVLCIAIAGCGDDAPGATTPVASESLPPSSTQTEALLSLSERIGAEGRLKPAVPTYLPTGVALVPCVKCVHALYPELITITFSGGAPDPATLRCSGLTISQGKSSGEFALGEALLHGEMAGGDWFYPGGDEDKIGYSLKFRAGGRDFLVSGTWTAPSGQVGGVDAIIHNETRMIANSILDDMRARGLDRES